jgi:hypothetical protein
MLEWLDGPFLEWLRHAFQEDSHLSLPDVAARLAAAFLLGTLVAGIYRLTQGKDGNQATVLMATLVMLTVLIAIVTQVIGRNQARAFSLVGALAIIRFRTIVEDTRDTAFVIFAVAVGMATGAGFLLLPLIGIPFAATAALVFRPRAATTRVPLDFLLSVRVGLGHAPTELLRASFDKYLETARLTATATARQGVALDLTYAVRLRQESAALALVTELNGLEGVQSVELREKV